MQFIFSSKEKTEVNRSLSRNSWIITILCPAASMMINILIFWSDNPGVFETIMTLVTIYILNFCPDIIIISVFILIFDGFLNTIGIHAISLFILTVFGIA